MGRLKDFWNRITGIEAANYQRQVAQMQIRLNTAHNQVNEAKISAKSLKTQLKEAKDHAFVSQKEAGENLDIFTHRFTEAMSKAMGAYIELVAPKVGWSKIYEAQVILADTLSYDPSLIEFAEAKKILMVCGSKNIKDKGDVLFVITSPLSSVTKIIS